MKVLSYIDDIDFMDHDQRKDIWTMFRKYDSHYKGGCNIYSYVKSRLAADLLPRHVTL